MTDKSGSFYEFQKLCVEIANENSYNEKTNIVANFVKNKFKGDLYLLCRLLLAREDQRVYNMRDKQFAKYLSRALDCELSEVLSDLEKGDMSQTAKDFLESSDMAQSRSTLTLKAVDQYLDKLAKLTKEDEQYAAVSEILEQCTGDDIKYLWKIMDHDLKINIGAKFVLTALHPKAFDAYKNSNNLKMIIERIQNHTLNEITEKSKEKKETSSEFSAQIELFLPVKPMLARAAHSTEESFQRCTSGVLYTEIKYDGERLQIHKKGKDFQFFSRNLKKVREYKVEGVTEHLPKATKADTIILDAEVLLMDTHNRKPLPFGTLGVHKKNAFKDATICVFLFDILYLNGKSLMSTPMKERRKIMEENITVIPNRIEISQLNIVKNEDQLAEIMTTAIGDGLEGLVIKDSMSIYEPNARHWLKMKKDYIQGMADSADLLVLGAYYGTGSRGGVMGSFLMGCYDKKTDTYKTVCKVANGFDDECIAELQESLEMIKIFKDHSKVPDWLDIAKSLTPDFVCKNPKTTPVWEIEGAEFSLTSTHTAGGYSIRFPRMIKMRDDKDWESHTNLSLFLDLAQNKKEFSMKKGKGTKKKAPKSPPKSPKREVKTVQPKLDVVAVNKKLSELVTTTTTKTSSASLSVGVTIKNKIRYVENGNATEPLGSDINKIIINFVGLKETWNGEVTSVLSNKFPKVEQAFKKEKVLLGDVQFVKIADQGSFSTFVATMVVRNASDQFEKSAYDQAMVNLVNEAKRRNASVHIYQYRNIEGLDWENHLEKSLRISLVSHNISLYVYTTIMKTVAKRPRSDDEEKPKEISEKKSKTEATTKPTSNIFSDVFVVFPKGKNYSSLKKKVEEMGGNVSDKWVPFGKSQSTHLISSSINETYEHVEKLGGIIVREEWIEDSYNRQQKLAEKDYIFDANMEISPSEKNNSGKLLDVLPAVFSGVYAYLHKCENEDVLKRYLIAFDADVVNDASEATHILSDAWDKELVVLKKENKALKVVDSAWAWDSINRKTLLSESLFKLNKE